MYNKAENRKKIEFAEFVKAGVEFVVEMAKNNKNTNTGDRSAATNTGDYSTAIAEGENSIAIVTGYQGKAKGKKGCWIVCTERDKEGNILFVKSAKVDGQKIKEDTFYTLENGEFVESEDKTV